MPDARQVSLSYRESSLFSHDLKIFFYDYKPYKLLLSADLSCAIVIAGITLSLTLCARYLTESILPLGASDALAQIIYMTSIMLALVGIHAFCKFFVGHMGHFMGALIERDIRGELFLHLQTQLFSFYDEHKISQLMTASPTTLIISQSCITTIRRIFRSP